MKQATRAGRRLTADIALACSAILLPAVALASAGPARPMTASSPATHPQHRQLAVTTLRSFKVVLTATRAPGTGPGPMATVTAAGYRHTSRGWKLIATKRIGQASQWFWYPAEVCGLTVTQLKPGPSTATFSDTITVSLLQTPALGCSRTYARHWRP
jgi:hypothetical protein